MASRPDSTGLVARCPAEPDDPALKIPHMGWNTLTLDRPHALFQGIPTGPDGLHAYFVHSYHFAPETDDVRVATTDYGGVVTAFVARDNVAGSQFHPEKSQKPGIGAHRQFPDVETIKRHGS